MGASFIFTVQPRHSGGLTAGPGDTTNTWQHLPCWRFDSFEQFAESAPEACAIVAVEMGGEPLETFRHPPRAVYLLGAEDFGLPPKVLAACHFHVSLPAVRSFSMNVAAVGSVILYDRMLKRLLLDPYPHAPNATKPGRRLAAAIAGKVRRAAFMASKQGHLRNKSGSVYAAAAACPSMLQVMAALNDQAEPFFVVSALPARVAPLPDGSALFEPASLRVRCLDLRAAHALLGLASGGRCCTAALVVLDERKICVDLRTRRAALQVHGSSSSWLREAWSRLRRLLGGRGSGLYAARAAGAAEAGLEEAFQARFAEAEEEMQELSRRLSRAMPGWATGGGREPRSDDDDLTEATAQLFEKVPADTPPRCAEWGAPPKVSRPARRRQAAMQPPAVNTKGERQLLQAPKPVVTAELPAALRKEERLRFDPLLYDLRGEAAVLLETAGPQVGFGAFEGDSRELEAFTASPSVFDSFKYEKQWRQCVREAEGLLRAYERLVTEVVCPELKARMGEAFQARPTTFFYQFPPTLRLQPGPSSQFRRVHRDAEYGHQAGEVNFWMPLTDYAKTKVTLWVESAGDAGDFHPLELDYGDIGMFHGTLCRHWVPANETAFTRVSMDFRIGVGDCFDPSWTLPGIGHVHGRRQCLV